MASVSSSPDTHVQIVRAARELRAELARRLAPLGLHPGQEQLLEMLWETDGRAQAEVAAELGIEPPTVTRMVQRLEANGFVERAAHPVDRRSVQVWLTEQGREVRPRVRRVLRGLRQQATRGLTERQEAQLATLLDRVSANLEA